MLLLLCHDSSPSPLHLPTIVEQLVYGLSELTKSEMEAKLEELRKFILMKAEEKIDEMSVKIWGTNLNCIGDTKLEHQVKEKIEKNTVDIEVGQAKTRLQELGEDILEKEKYTTDKVHKMVQFLVPPVGFETQVDEDILKKMAHEDLEDIKDDLTTTVNKLVEGLSILTQSEMETNLTELRQVTQMKIKETSTQPMCRLTAR